MGARFHTTFRASRCMRPRRAMLCWPFLPWRTKDYKDIRQGSVNPEVFNISDFAGRWYLDHD